MRKNIFLAIAAVSLFVSCEEVGPPISFHDLGNWDSAYTVSPPAPEPRRVLVEEATGVKCGNCPAGAEILKQAEQQNPDRVVIIGLHHGNLTSPIDPYSQYDFRTDFAKDLFTFFGGEPNKPAAVFDRTKQGGGYFVDNRTAWFNIINDRLTQTAPVIIEVLTEFDDVTKEDSIKVRLTYTQQVTKKQSVSVVIVEDDITDAQEDSRRLPPLSKYILDYKHNHILRDMITPLNGLSIPETPAIKASGTVFEKTFVYKVPSKAETDPKWNLDNCRVIVFVHNSDGDDREVVQAIQVNFK
jgi:hypothetical protein